MRRIATLVILLALAPTAVSADVEPAAFEGDFIEVSPGYFRDPACGTQDSRFSVDIWDDIDHGGMRVRFCSSYSDFCMVPQGVQSVNSVACDAAPGGALWAFGSINDSANGMRVNAIGGGDSCRVVFYAGKDWQGYSAPYWDPVDIDRLPNPPLANTWSSVRRVC